MYHAVQMDYQIRLPTPSYMQQYFTCNVPDIIPCHAYCSILSHKILIDMVSLRMESWHQLYLISSRFLTVYKKILKWTDQWKGGKVEQMMFFGKNKILRIHGDNFFVHFFWFEDQGGLVQLFMHCMRATNMVTFTSTLQLIRSLGLWPVSMNLVSGWWEYRDRGKTTNNTWIRGETFKKTN